MEQNDNVNVNYLYHNLDEGNRCCGVYLDLQKAFDAVNHELLLSKLYNYGIRGIVHKWFCSYITNRQQFTCVAGARSSSVSITSGVPQGSVLGPLLFLIYVNDIGNAVPNEIINLFADDTNLFVFRESFSIVNQKANECLNELYMWFIANKLSLNLTKTCYMVFKTKCDDNVELFCGQRVIQKVDKCHYLGVVIDNELKWTLHIEQLYCKLIKFTRIFYKLRTKLPERILKQLYFAFVHSRIMFGIKLYASTCSIYIDKLIKLNNKLIRILQNRPLLVSTRELYLKSNTSDFNET